MGGPIPEIQTMKTRVPLTVWRITIGAFADNSSRQRVEL